VAALTVAAAVWLTAETLAGRGISAWPGPRPRSRRGPSRQVWLSQAGAAVTPGQFWAISTGVAAGVFVLLFAIDQTLVVAALPAVAAGALPYAYWAALRRKAAAARFEAWPDALRFVIGRLGAGISTLHEALEALSDSGPEALRAPMGRYVRLSARVGIRPALEAVRAELADPVSDPVLLTFGIAAEEGSEQVVRILSNLGSQIAGDLALAEKITTLQTQSRVATWAVFVLPYLLLVFLCGTQGFYRAFFSSALGYAVVLGGAAMSTVGFFLARRLARPIATTERVFVAEAAR